MIALLLALLGTLVPSATQAATRTGLTFDCTSGCTLDDFFQQFIILSQYGMGLLGVLAVLMFLFAGFQFVTAAGRSSKIENGKQIITGTFVGLAIAFTAYIIINTTIMALTGAKTNVRDLFAGPIAVLFPGQSINVGGRKTSIEKTFSNLPGENRSDCRSSNNTTYRKDCSREIFCADPGDGPGPVQNYQAWLQAHNCNCTNLDGCYGPRVTQCVRYFQVSNRLPATGVIDQRTEDLLLNSDTQYDCKQEFAQNIIAKLPAINEQPTTSSNSSSTGCCTVGNNADDVSRVHYCVEQVSQKTCNALSSLDKRFTAGEFCGRVPECGYCSDVNNRAFKFAGKHWCENVAFQNVGAAVTGLRFSPGLCNQLQTCKDALLLTPEN